MIVGIAPFWNVKVLLNKNDFFLHRVLRQRPTQLGFILIWFDAVVRHGAKQKSCFVLNKLKKFREYVFVGQLMPLFPVESARLAAIFFWTPVKSQMPKYAFFRCRGE
jgi:hypothetical protein